MQAAQALEPERAVDSRAGRVTSVPESGYKSMDGKPGASVTDDIITQVFNHSSYHRGQVAMLIAQAGGERPVTDYIFLARAGLLD